jgi:hypothetical protein
LHRSLWDLRLREYEERDRGPRDEREGDPGPLEGAFYPAGVEAQDFVGKVRGFEVLHERENLEKCGVRDGSTILLASRRRRPVK